MSMSSMLMQSLSGMGGAGQSATGKKYTDAMDTAGAGASDAESMFAKQMQSFDPSAAFDKYAQGATGQFQKQLGLNLRDMAGKAVGAGRFNSGFFDEDQGELMRGMSNDFQNNLSSKALDVAGMQQRQGEFMGNYSLQKGGQYLDLLSGQLDREQGAENAKRRQDSDFWGSLMKAGATAAFLL